MPDGSSRRLRPLERDAYVGSVGRSVGVGPMEPRCGFAHLIRERVKSGLAAAQARGVVLGRQKGFRPSDKKAKRVLSLHKEGMSYRLIGRNLSLSKNTVMEIVQRASS